MLNAIQHKIYFKGHVIQEGVTDLYKCILPPTQQTDKLECEGIQSVTLQFFYYGNYNDDPRIVASGSWELITGRLGDLHFSKGDEHATHNTDPQAR